MTAYVVYEYTPLGDTPWSRDLKIRISKVNVLSLKLVVSIKVSLLLKLFQHTYTTRPVPNVSFGWIKIYMEHFIQLFPGSFRVLMAVIHQTTRTLLSFP